MHYYYTWCPETSRKRKLVNPNHIWCRFFRIHKYILKTYKLKIFSVDTALKVSLTFQLPKKGNKVKKMTSFFFYGMYIPQFYACTAIFRTKCILYV